MTRRLCKSGNRALAAQSAHVRTKAVGSRRVGSALLCMELPPLGGAGTDRRAAAAHRPSSTRIVCAHARLPKVPAHLPFLAPSRVLPNHYWWKNIARQDLLHVALRESCLAFESLASSPRSSPTHPHRTDNTVPTTWAFADQSRRTLVSESPKA